MKFILFNFTFLTSTVLSSIKPCWQQSKIRVEGLLGLALGLMMGQDSVVGVATCCRLEVPGIKSRSGRDFPHSSRPALGPTRPPVRCVPGFVTGSKAAGAWR
jgi:hypothetical protein